MYIIICIFFMALNPVLALANSTESTRIQTILQGMQFCDDLIASGSGTYKYEWIQVDSLSTRGRDIFYSENTSDTKYFHYKTYDIEFIFSGPKLRFDVQFISPVPNDEGEYLQCIRRCAYNAEKMDLLCFDRIYPKGVYSISGQIQGDNAVSHRLNPLFYYLGDYERYPGSALQNSRYTKMELNKDMVIDGYECNVISTYDTESNSKIYLWISPNVMYRPIKIRVEGMDFIVEEYYRYEAYDNMWFISKKESHKKYIDHKSQKEIIYSIKKITVKEKFKLNIAVSDDVFSIDFPEGMNILDDRIKQVLKVIKDNEIIQYEPITSQ